MHARRRGATGLPDDEANRGLIVGYWICIRHRTHSRESTSSRGARTTGNRLHVFPARLAKMRVNIDEPWRNDVSVTVDDLGMVSGFDAAADRFDDSA